MKALVLPLILVAGSAVADPLPINPQVTQGNIQETICRPGYTKKIRPPVVVTNAIKKKRMRDLGLPFELMGDFQLDHKLSLSIGGHPSNESNLVLQDGEDAHQKDGVEHCTQRAICDGRISLDEAQKQMWSDWRGLIPLCRGGK